MSNKFGDGCFLAAVVLAISMIPAWLTHVIVCIVDEKYIFLVAGAIFFPIGVIHGWGVWLGAW